MKTHPEEFGLSLRAGSSVFWTLAWCGAALASLMCSQAAQLQLFIVSMVLSAESVKNKNIRSLAHLRISQDNLKFLFINNAEPSWNCDLFNITEPDQIVSFHCFYQLPMMLCWCWNGCQTQRHPPSSCLLLLLRLWSLHKGREGRRSDSGGRFGKGSSLLYWLFMGCLSGSMVEVMKRRHTQDVLYFHQTICFVLILWFDLRAERFSQNVQFLLFTYDQFYSKVYEFYKLSGS